MPERPVSEAATVEVRAKLADHINAAQTRGAVVFLLSRGRRVAALVPVADAERLIAEEMTSEVQR